MNRRRGRKSGFRCSAMVGRQSLGSVLSTGCHDCPSTAEPSAQGEFQSQDADFNLWDYLGPFNLQELSGTLLRLRGRERERPCLQNGWCVWVLVPPSKGLQRDVSRHPADCTASEVTKVTILYLSLCSLKPQLYEKKRGRQSLCLLVQKWRLPWWRRPQTGDSWHPERGLFACRWAATWQFSVWCSTQWAENSVQWDVSQLCLHNPEALGGSWVRVGVYTKWYISQQGALASNESQEYPGLH